MKKATVFLLLLFFVLIGSIQAYSMDLEQAELFFEGLEEGRWRTEIHISFYSEYREIISLQNGRDILSLRRVYLTSEEDKVDFQLIVFSEDEIRMDKDKITKLMEKESLYRIINWAEDRSLNAAILNN